MGRSKVEDRHYGRCTPASGPDMEAVVAERKQLELQV